MKKNYVTFNIITIIGMICLLALDFVGTASGALTADAAVWIGILIVIAACAVLAVTNYKHSAYGANFKTKYPDSSLNK